MTIRMTKRVLLGTCDPSAIVNEGPISDPVDDVTEGAEDSDSS